MSRSFAFRAAAGALLSLLVLAGVAPAAAARPNPGDVGWSRVDLEPTNCPLRRIDTQLVRCDSLTGAGVPAPLFIAELQALGEVGSSHIDLEPTTARCGASTPKWSAATPSQVRACRLRCSSPSCDPLPLQAADALRLLARSAPLRSICTACNRCRSKEGVQIAPFRLGRPGPRRAPTTRTEAARTARCPRRANRGEPPGPGRLRRRRRKATERSAVPAAPGGISWPSYPTPRAAARVRRSDRRADFPATAEPRRRVPDRRSPADAPTPRSTVALAAIARARTPALAQYEPPSEPSQNWSTAVIASPARTARLSTPARRATVPDSTWVISAAAATAPITSGRAAAASPAPRGSSAQWDDVDDLQLLAEGLAEVAGQLAEETAPPPGWPLTR